ncbi:MAG: response regulator [Alteromonadaceae bacterium]|nr:response regulator [Alteromonadaceae bacterium]
MLFVWISIAAVYLGFVFWLGTWGDGHSKKAKAISSHRYVYGFALAIYCTAWTYFGAVGEAARNNWNYLPILLGPILLYLFGYRILIKLIKVSKKQHITTIADLISSRYGKRQIVALVVTLIVLLASIPYIALQLQAIGSAFTLVTGSDDVEIVVFSASVFIALFCVFFGTRRTDVTEYRHGLMLSIAFESVLKLVALFLVALVAVWFLLSEDMPVSTEFMSEKAIMESFAGGAFWLQTLVAGLAVLCLPRQFHVAIIDNLNIKHVDTARWLFPIYLAIIAVFIPTIASAGSGLFAGSDIKPDNYVIALASESGFIGLKIIVFLGGISAAMAMIIISTLTLSTMLSNDVILPKLLSRETDLAKQQSQIGLILGLRRVVILTILLLSYACHILLSSNMPLSSIGLLAFSLVVQLSPAILFGLYWQKGHAHGVIAGLVAGIFTWVLMLIMPILSGVASDGLSSELISITAVIALAVNCLFYLLFSYLSKPSLIDKIQASAFVNEVEEGNRNFNDALTNATAEDLVTVLQTFLGDQRAEHLLKAFELNHERKLDFKEAPDSDFINFCERSLGGVLGASSSSLLIKAVLLDKQFNFEQMVSVFDDTTQAIKTNQTILFTALESIPQGISVIDKDLCLVAWNQQYLKMFNYPKDMISVGTPVEDLVRFNAKRGECGVGELEQLVSKRMEHLRVGKPHKFSRQRSDGRVIEMIGNPLPNGGFVTSFNDITEYIEIQRALKEANIDLEKRVSRRTDEVKTINNELRNEISQRKAVEQELVEAREIAEQANASKTRFLALASHDVLQPINSAKLYLSSLDSEQVSEDVRKTLDKINSSVESSESLIATLLEIAKLDQGALQPTMTSVSLHHLVNQLRHEFTDMAAKKGLSFKVLGSDDVWLNTDSVYLQRILRNLLSNAIKYTQEGGVRLSIRPRKKGVLIQVWDSGEGIAESDIDKVFNDFYRAHDGNERGVGLGLAVVERLSRLLGVSLSIKSELYRGTCMSLLLDYGERREVIEESVAKVSSLSGLNVLCLDDDQNNIDAMHTLLSKWQVDVVTASNTHNALLRASKDEPSAILADFQLGEELDGLDCIALIRERLDKDIPAVLVTAVREKSVIERAEAMNVKYLSKPVKPAKLRMMLRGIKQAL